MKNRLACVVLLLITSLTIACDKKSPLNPTTTGPSGPTPANDPAATADSLYYFIGPCASTMRLSSFGPSASFQIERMQLMDTQARQLTAAGMSILRELDEVPIANIPTCIPNLAANNFALVITSADGNLMHARTARPQ